MTGGTRCSFRELFLLYLLCLLNLLCLPFPHAAFCGPLTGGKPYMSFKRSAR
jgi:hypothetical protein